MGKKEVVDPRQQLITKFFQVKDAEEMGKFECSDCLNQKWKMVLDNVLSTRSCFLIGNGKCKQLSDWSELELSTVLDSCALRNLSVLLEI